MTRERLTIFDTTLRDGAQTTGVDFSLADKVRVAQMLDELGVDYVEGGYPGANPMDTEFFRNKPVKHARFAAFGMTKRAGRSASNDPGIAALMESAADTITFVAKTWDYHVHVALGCTLDENLDGIADSIKYVRQHGREAILDCEHFFDGFKADPDYALQCARTAHEVRRALDRAVRHQWRHAAARDRADCAGGCVAHLGRPVGIHTHNDTENAVANTFAAVRAGVRHIQGTLNGLGERCGNANLCSIIPTLLLKQEYAQRFEIGVTLEQLKGLKKISATVNELLNQRGNRHAPYVGESAFATKAGIHASAVLKDPRTYEHVVPESVGNQRKVLVSDQAGRSNILSELERLGVHVAKDDPRVNRVLEQVKEREALGYAYEGADASFELLARRMLGEAPSYFEVERFSVNVERRHNALGDLVSVSEAIVKVKVGDEVMISAAEGNGPVNALDLALRKDLGRYQRYIEDLELLDYRVRVFQGGTDAVTRVLIEFGDSKGARWSTVGVSANVVDASFQALIDSIEYKLLKAGA